MSAFCAIVADKGLCGTTLANLKSHVATKASPDSARK